MTNIFPERDRCPENPTPKSLNRDAKMVTRSILATQPTVPRVPLGKAMAFASGLVLGMFSDPLNAAPPGGGDIVQVLCDALLSAAKYGRILGQSDLLPVHGLPQPQVMAPDLPEVAPNDPALTISTLA